MVYEKNILEIGKYTKNSDKMQMIDIRHALWSRQERFPRLSLIGTAKIKNGFKVKVVTDTELVRQYFESQREFTSVNDDNTDDKNDIFK